MSDPILTLEHEILGAVLAYGRSSLDQVPDLAAVDFEAPALRDVFAACTRAAEEGLQITYPVVGGMLRSNSVAFGALNELQTVDNVLLSMLPAYVRRLRSSNAARRAIRLGREIAGLGSKPAEETLSRAMELAQEILRGATAGGDPLLPMLDVVKAELDLLDRVRAGEEPERIEIGIREIDWSLYVEPGDLIIVGGDTSSGKSAFCGQLAAFQAKHKKPVVFITSEMSHRQMLVRITSAMTGKPIAQLINPKTASQQEIGPIYARMAELPIYFQRTFPPRIEEAIVAIRTGVRKYGAKLAVIDYAQRLANSDDEHQEQAIARIAAEAKNLALELGIVIVAAAQVNRNVTHRKDPRPCLADLRGSGRLEQDANAVLFVYQPSRYGLPGDPEIIIAKQRNGRLDSVKVHFAPETCTFHGLEDKECD